ncbi:MAG TPA: Gfo/Idh/MocA family oxidoreductase [Tepidisphaeraceae bacterium]|nr:Gfo/Idh/MocA family oxidoreductase [Tepidisphaeraceae bacterium]
MAKNNGRSRGGAAGAGGSGGGAGGDDAAGAGTINVCLVGQKFMGRTHSNAFLKVGKFFDVPLLPVMHTIAGRNEPELIEFKQRWGWRNATTSWQSAVTDPEIQLVDIGTPNHLHAEMSIAALEAGKHVACEKPLAGTLADARQMRDAARKVARKQKTFVWYNYRRVPAVALAHQLVKDGKLGRIFHVRAFYLQDWGGPGVPLLWRFQKKFAGSGAHGDLNAHVIDMARFITGDEIVEVTGAIAETFIKERDLPSSGPTGGITAGAKGGGGGGAKKGRSDVDDALLFLARFKGGAIASFEASRLATGNQNKNGLEINGERGSIRFNFEDMNHLEFYDATVERRVQGWTPIMVTHGGTHPYVGNWWPDAHIIGYEHGFVNQVADMMNVLGGKPPVVPLPDFEDAYRTQQVLEAAVASAENRSPVKVAEMK